MNNSNSTPVPLRFIKVENDDFRVHGAEVSLDDHTMRLGLNRVRLLQRFNWQQRDARGIRVRPMAELTDEQVADLERFGFGFEPAALAGNWHPTIPWEIGNYYRQGI